MTSPDGTYEAVVLDDRGGYIGQDVYSGMAQAGWTTSPSPGPLAQQITQEGAQQQASAAAATQQQIADLQSSLQGEVRTRWPRTRPAWIMTARSRATLNP